VVARVSVAVLIPWRTTDCPHRRRAFGWTVAQLAVHGWPVVIGRHDDGPWIKSLAVADALAQTDADVLVIHDADVWSPELDTAVQAVEDGATHAIPHRSVHRLSEASTARLIAGEDPEGLELAEPAYRGVAGGGVTVLRREAYEAAPIDARFVGWSGEDEAFGWGLATLFGAPWRPTYRAPLWHLGHPSQPRVTRARGSLASWDLRKRYARAQHDPVAMRALIQEAKAHELDGPDQLARDDRAEVPG
jgi:hypothetical protein